MSPDLQNFSYMRPPSGTGSRKELLTLKLPFFFHPPRARRKAKLSKANKNRLAMLRGGTTSTFGGTSSSISGTASSVSFTPHQGLELVADKKDDKAREANAKWFAEGSFSIVR